jgi:hypothetical protein
MSKPASGVETDRRHAPRIVTQRAGKVLSGTFAWDCVIRDLSENGVRVQMLAGVRPPSRVQVVDLLDGMAWDAEVIWQKDREFGLRVIRTYDLRGLTPASARMAKNIWSASQGRISAS